MTSFYMFRLVWLTFFGRSRMTAEVEHHVHESPLSMTSVLVVLAAPVGDRRLPVDPALPRAAARASGNRSRVEHYETPLLIASIALAFAGLAGAAYVYGGAGGRAERLAARFATLHRVLSASTTSTRPTSADRQAAPLDLGRVFPRGSATARCSTVRCTASPRSAAAPRPASARIQNGSLHVYALLVLIRDRRVDQLCVASCLTPWDVTMSDAGLLNLVLYLPLRRSRDHRAAAQERRHGARPFARGDAAAIRHHRVAVSQVRRIDARTSSSRRDCHGSPHGGCITR
jgi:hypothetical protein